MRLHRSISWLGHGRPQGLDTGCAKCFEHPDFQCIPRMDVKSNGCGRIGDTLDHTHIHDMDLFEYSRSVQLVGFHIGLVSRDRTVNRQGRRTPVPPYIAQRRVTWEKRRTSAEGGFLSASIVPAGAEHTRPAKIPWLWPVHWHGQRDLLRASEIPLARGRPRELWQRRCPPLPPRTRTGKWHGCRQGVVWESARS